MYTLKPSQHIFRSGCLQDRQRFCHRLSQTCHVLPSDKFQNKVMIETLEKMSNRLILDGSAYCILHSLEEDEEHHMWAVSDNDETNGCLLLQALIILLVMMLLMWYNERES